MTDWTFCKCGALADDPCLICGYSESGEAKAAFDAARARIEEAIRREMWLTMPVPVDHVAAACLAGARAANGWGFQGFRDGLD